MENGDFNIPKEILDDYEEQLDGRQDDDITDDEESGMPEIEMSAYEKVREENIKEFEALKKASGLFDD